MKAIKTTTNTTASISSHVQDYHGEQIIRDTIEVRMPNGASLRVEIATYNDGITSVTVFGHERETTQQGDEFACSMLTVTDYTPTPHIRLAE